MWPFKMGKFFFRIYTLAVPHQRGQHEAFFVGEGYILFCSLPSGRSGLEGRNPSNACHELLYKCIKLKKLDE
jgi:hypothetical protein